MSMRTRRKSKAAAAAAAELDAESVAPSEAGTAGQTRVEFYVPIPEDLDFDYLSRVFPDVSFDTPSPDSVLSLYRLVVTQAVGLENAHHDLEESRAENERKDVELDQALQDRESSVSSLETQVKGLQEELTKVKQDRDALASSKSNLESQISTMNSSQSVSSTELDSFKHRVEDTEREKRDLLSVVSRLKEDSAQRDEEIQTLRTSLKQARQDQQTLETQLRELRSTESSTKFKLDSLTQQLQLAKDEADRTSKELAKKSEDFANYRHEKHASHSQLQSEHDALKEKYASTEGTLKALRDAHNVQSRQLTQSLTRQQDLSARNAEQDATYASEVAGLRRLIEMVEAREAQSKAIVENVEQSGRPSMSAPIAVNLLCANRSTESDCAQRHPRRASKNWSAGSTDVLMQSIMSLSPTVAIASRAQRTGKTFTEVYADHVRLQDEYAKKCAEYDRMDRTLAQVLAQIEERAPILAQQRAEYERLQSEAAQLASQLADALSERDSSASNATEVSQRLSKTIRENESLQKQLNDLGRQVQTLLKEIARRQDPTIPSDEELEADESTPADNIDEVITNHLVLFRSVSALQAQNQKLLGIVREMGAKMEAEEREYRETLEKEQGEAVREAHEAITALQEQLEAQRRAHDVLLARAERNSSLKESHGQANGEVMDSDLAKDLAEIQEQFDREVAQLSTQLAKANANWRLLGIASKCCRSNNQLTLRDLDDVSKRNRDLYERFTSVDIECNRVTEDLIAANGKMDQLRNECANLRAEKRIWEVGFASFGL
ncbi:hypothetical protein EDB84DRAFT_1571134 [Lactarius hengduanensis]|nr:hypothetical protein EDB84DRAFT_1571134 [Lactarius hengduanensis]